MFSCPFSGTDPYIFLQFKLSQYSFSELGEFSVILMYNPVYDQALRTSRLLRIEPEQKFEFVKVPLNELPGGFCHDPVR